MQYSSAIDINSVTCMYVYMLYASVNWVRWLGGKFYLHTMSGFNLSWLHAMICVVVVHLTWFVCNLFETICAPCVAYIKAFRCATGCGFLCTIRIGLLLLLLFWEFLFAIYIWSNSLSVAAAGGGNQEDMILPLLARLWRDDVRLINAYIILTARTHNTNTMCTKVRRCRFNWPFSCVCILLLAWHHAQRIF